MIDWTLAFRADAELRETLSESRADPRPANLPNQYSIEYGETIEEGINSLKKAISLRPNYDDAMAYLNLLYRRKADVVDNQTDREALIDIADDLVEKVKENKTKTADWPAETQTAPREMISCVFLGLHFGVEMAAMELNVYCVAQVHLIAGTQYIAGRIRRNSVAAL